MNRGLAALLLLGLTASTSNANGAIINGSFEDISGMTDFGTFANGVPTGWSFTGTEVQALQSPPFSPSGVDGLYFIEISASPDFGTLSQSVTGLAIGQQYDLSFLWGNRTGGYDFTVEMGGNSFSASGGGIVNMIAESFTFTATATSVDLNLIWHDSGAGSFSGGALDAFVLDAATPIPEPSSLALLTIGTLGIIGHGRRRKRHAA